MREAASCLPFGKYKSEMIKETIFAHQHINTFTHPVRG
jgi:hypothetical protein